jgi:membrane protease YdiL (CAAX protease family)
MKNLVNWKLFFILLGATLISSVMALPYIFSLVKGMGVAITPVLIIAQIIQGGILFSIAIYFGLRMSKKIGLGLPIVEGLLNKENQKENIKLILWPSIGSGVLAAMLIIIFSFPFGSLSIDFLKAAIAVPAWKSFLISFYGGITEEVLMRLFLMTLIVWMTLKIKSTSEGKATVVGVWFAIILSSIIFGLGHLPITGSLAAITPVVVVRAIVLNGIGGIIFGWLYWKKGLESAMIAHFTADICLHVVLPLLASQFMQL